MSSMFRNDDESTISECGAPCCPHDGTNATCLPFCVHAFVCTALVSNMRWPEDGSTIDTGTGTFTYCCAGNGGCIAVPPTTICFVGLGIVW